MRLTEKAQFGAAWNGPSAPHHARTGEGTGEAKQGCGSIFSVPRLCSNLGVGGEAPCALHTPPTPRLLSNMGPCTPVNQVRDGAAPV